MEQAADRPKAAAVFSPPTESILFQSAYEQRDTDW